MNANTANASGGGRSGGGNRSRTSGKVREAVRDLAFANASSRYLEILEPDLAFAVAVAASAETVTATSSSRSMPTAMPSQLEHLRQSARHYHYHYQSQHQPQSQSQSQSFRGKNKRRSSGHRRRRNSIGSVGSSGGNVSCGSSTATRKTANGNARGAGRDMEIDGRRDVDEREWRSFLTGLDGAIEREAVVAPPPMLCALDDDSASSGSSSAGSSSDYYYDDSVDTVVADADSDCGGSRSSGSEGSEGSGNPRERQRRRRHQPGMGRRRASLNDIISCISIPSIAPTVAPHQRQWHSEPFFKPEPEPEPEPLTPAKPALRRGRYSSLISREGLFINSYLQRTSSRTLSVSNDSSSSSDAAASSDREIRFDTPTVYHLARDGHLEKVELSWTSKRPPSDPASPASASSEPSSGSLDSANSKSSEHRRSAEEPRVRTAPITYSRTKRRQMYLEKKQKMHQKMESRHMMEISQLCNIVHNFVDANDDNLRQ